jgi:5-methylcytosine-specific restriction endonuclease McrA
MRRRKIAEGTRFRVLQRDKFRCRYCGAHGSETELHIDHVQPVSAGGTNNPLNLVTACRACNLGKHARPPEWDLTRGAATEANCGRGFAMPDRCWKYRGFRLTELCTPTTRECCA